MSPLRSPLTALLPLIFLVTTASADWIMWDYVDDTAGVTLSASFEGSGPFTYRWRRDGVPVSTTTSTSSTAQLTIPAMQRSTPATYIVEATAGGVTVASPPLSLSLPPVAPPRILQQSTGVRLAGPTPGTTYLLGVRVSGVGPFTYHWRRNGIEFKAETTAFAQSEVDITALGVGEYVIEIGNSAGTVATAPMRITQGDPTEPLYIIHQPLSYGVEYGAAAELSVVYASASGEPAFQWRKNGAAISGKTLARLRIESFTPADAGSYSVTLTTATASVTSDAATLSILGRTVAEPVISVQPQGRALRTGECATLGVVADGGYGSTYQWYKDGAEIAGATSKAFALVNAGAADAGQYLVEVANRFGKTRSAPATITVSGGTPAALAPMVLGSARNVSVEVNGSAALQATVVGNPTPRLQWYHDGVAIAGATSSTLVVENFRPTSVGAYQIEATNDTGTVRATVAWLYLKDVNWIPRFTSELPRVASVEFGGSIKFSCTVDGSPSTTLEWRKDGKPLDPFLNTRYSAGRSGDAAVLSVGDVDSGTGAGWDAAGTYTVVATNSVGSATSSALVLEVRPPETAGIYFTAPNVSQPLIGTAVYVGPDRSMTLLTTGGRRQNLPRINAKLAVGTDGTFSSTVSNPLNGAAVPISGSFDSRYARVNESWGELVLSRAPAKGPASSVAGYWEGLFSGAAGGQVAAIVSPTGDAVVIFQPRNGSSGALRGTLDSNNVLALPAGSSVYSVLQVRFSADGTFSGEFGTWDGFRSTFQGTRGAAPLRNWLANISTRGRAGPGVGSLLAGFVLAEPAARPILLRGAGPTLADFGVQDPLADPRLELIQDGAVLQQNDDWGSLAAEVTAASARLGAFALRAASKDAALTATLRPGMYTAAIGSGKSGSADGVTLAEVYDSGDCSDVTVVPPLVNISTRGYVGKNEDMLTAGIVVGGQHPKRILIRAVGPGLARFGVTGLLSDPMLRLFKGEVFYAENDNWEQYLAPLMQHAGAFDLTVGSKDAVIVTTLAPGNYTAQVSGVSGTTGAALVEVYEVNE